MNIGTQPSDPNKHTAAWPVPALLPFSDPEQQLADSVLSPQPTPNPVHGGGIAHGTSLL